MTYRVHWNKKWPKGKKNELNFVCVYKGGQHKKWLKECIRVYKHKTMHINKKISKLDSIQFCLTILNRALVHNKTNFPRIEREVINLLNEEKKILLKKMVIVSKKCKIMNLVNLFIAILRSYSHYCTEF